MKSIWIPAAALAVAGCTVQEPVGPSAEARLAAELEGLVPEEPVSCVSLRQLGGNKSIGEGVILFEGIGSTVYVNRPPAGCPVIRPGRALRVRTTTSNLCVGEIVSVWDPVSGTDFGSCGLGEFVPYRRPD